MTTQYPDAGMQDALWPEDRIETLLPANCFDAESAGERYTRLLRADAPGTGSGADSPTVQLWLGCRCAGWAEPPTGEEFHAAIRTAEPSRRQIAILDAWANQTTWTEVLQAWAEHAERTNLWAYGAALEEVMAALGAARYGYSPRHNQYRAAFTEGCTKQTIEIWPNDPEPGGAERTADIDGGSEIVLATAQILKGKLERGEDALARDVIDVITAERLDPAGLEVAVNAITPPYARLVSAVWDRAKTTIARRAEAEFGDAVADPATLGPKAGEALLSRMYARIAIAVEDGRVVATTTTAGGTRRRREWTAAEAAARFRTSGLDAALGGMRQDAGRIRAAAMAATQAGRNEQVADCRTLS